MRGDSIPKTVTHSSENGKGTVLPMKILAITLARTACAM